MLPTDQAPAGCVSRCADTGLSYLRETLCSWCWTSLAWSGWCVWTSRTPRTSRCTGHTRWTRWKRFGLRGWRKTQNRGGGSLMDYHIGRDYELGSHETVLLHCRKLMLARCTGHTRRARRTRRGKRTRRARHSRRTRQAKPLRIRSIVQLVLLRRQHWDRRDRAAQEDFEDWWSRKSPILSRLVSWSYFLVH